jgi:ribosomal protein S18 acetylase RimI-like enzyme
VDVRAASEADHARVLAVVDEWWDGRQLSHLVQPLFFEHFGDTSLVAEDGDGLAGFLVGFLSSSRPDEAYIHLVGVRPDLRGSGLGRELYERFFAVVRDAGRTVVACQTSPVNTGSIAFHEALGFESSHRADWDKVVFRKRLA